jgi:hypothetical protein
MDVVDEFVRQLQEFEQSRDVEPLVALFARDTELSRLDGSGVHRGREGARDFWIAYRDQFGELSSRFTGDVRADGKAALEWVAEGTIATADGGTRPIRYPGVSLLEHDDAGITRFRTVYDSGPFLTPRASVA